MKLSPHQHQEKNEFRNIWTLRMGKAVIVLLLLFGVMNLATMLLKWSVL